MALTKEALLRRLFRHLIKQADVGLYGQVTIDFQDGHPLMTRTIQQRKLEHEQEVDGATEARLLALMAPKT